MVPDILIIDDEIRIRQVLNRFLSGKGFGVSEAGSGEEAATLLKTESPDVILLDLKMPGMDGLELLKKMRADGVRSKVIIMTAHGTIRSAVEAMREGAYDYITKPFSNEELFLLIRRALDLQSLEARLKNAEDQLKSRYSVSGIIAASPEMLAILDRVRRVADTVAPVIITGESGTGKDLIAKAIHHESSRRKNPFVTVNCSALPQTLIESELFGYRRGAFSGAEKAKRGLVETADGGTLFLDEIAEMGQEAQAKLLRFTQSGEFIPLGGTVSSKVDVRLVAATNKNLEEAIAAGEFREDLYYRLNVVRIELPPLRERLIDIPLLVDFFLKKHGESSGKPGARFEQRAIEKLMAHSWPGNVRELENIVRGALAMSGETIMTEDSVNLLQRRQTESVSVAAGPVTLSEELEKYALDVESRVIQAALRRHDGNRTRTAEELGITRQTLLSKMKKCGIS